MRRVVFGFSMMEVMVSMVIASLVVTAGTASVIAIMKSTNATTRRSSVDEESKMLMDYLVSNTQNVGGGSVRPWNGLWVENDCSARNGLPDCNGSDRLSTVMPNLDEECTVQNGTVGINGTLQFSTSGACCLTNDFNNTAAILVKSDGRYSRQVWLDNLDLGNCTVDYNQNTAQLAAFGVDPPGTWNNATLNTAEVTTYFLDIDQMLRIFRDSNGNGIYEPALLTSTSPQTPIETGELMADIYDFQLALGVDNNPEDGTLQDLNSTTDEWIYNTTGEVYNLATDGESLRFLSIGFMLGVAVQNQPPNQLKLFDGPLRTEFKADGIYLHPASSQSYLRNLLLFF